MRGSLVPTFILGPSYNAILLYHHCQACLIVTPRASGFPCEKMAPVSMSSAGRGIWPRIDLKAGVRLEGECSSHICPESNNQKRIISEVFCEQHVHPDCTASLQPPLSLSLPCTEPHPPPLQQLVGSFLLLYSWRVLGKTEGGRE